MIKIHNFPSYFVAKSFVNGLSDRKGIEISYDSIDELPEKDQYLVDWMITHNACTVQRGSTVYQLTGN